MRTLRNMPIRRKVVVVVMLTAGVALLLTFAALLSYEGRGFRAKLERDLATMAQIIGATSVPAMSFDDAATAGEFLGALKAEPQILAARLYWATGVPFASYARREVDVNLPGRPPADGYSFSDKRLTYTSALHDEEENSRVGTIVLVADFSGMHERLVSYSSVLAVVLLTSGLVALGLSAKLQSYISGPILNLARTTQLVSEKGDYSIRVPRETEDELGELITSFNQMLAQIQARDEELKRAHDSMEVRVAERTSELEQQIAERVRAQADLASSLSLMTATLESTADGILVVGNDGGVVNSNQKFAEMWGIPHGVMATRDDAQLLACVSPQLPDADAYLAKVEQICRDGLEETFDTVDLVDGRIFERHSQPHRIDGEIVGRVWSFSDITERAKADERIREQANLLDLAQDGIVVRDMNDVILYWNKGAERIYGWTKDEVVGSQMGHLFSTNREKFNTAKAATIELGEWTGNLPHLTKGGRQVVTESRWTLLRDAAGQPKSFLLINTDVTERKELEAQFLRSQRMESIGTLAGGIAHDLNNVLAPILMSADLLRGMMSDPEAEPLLEAVEQSAQRGADLVRQILYFARGVEGERVMLQTERIVKEIHKIARDTFPKDLEIRCETAPGLWPIVGDATQLHQVLLNLTVNARDAMPDGGRLTISAENFTGRGTGEKGANQPVSGTHILVKITDTGKGIPAELRDRIFEPFFTTKELGKGTGLGLSTAHAIVKGHGGILDLETAEGRGTTFKVYFPAVQTLLEERAQPEGRDQHHGSGETVLLVDDEPMVRMVTQRILEGSGYRVLTACDGASAVALYAERRQEVDIVLTDMMMPGLDGAATIRALRGINANVQIVAASGMITDERMNKACEAGASCVLRKPFSTEIMLETLHRVVSEGRIFRPLVSLKRAVG